MGGGGATWWCLLNGKQDARRLLVALIGKNALWQGLAGNDDGRPRVRERP